MDVVADVLSRLAPRALAVSRSVCRGWRAAADADARCQQQLRRAAAAGLLPVTLGGIFVQTNEGEPTAFFARPSMAHRIAGDLEHYLRVVRSCDIPRVVDCCNGLLLLDHDVDLVVNPATKQWARLPPYPKTALLTKQQGIESGDDYHYGYRFLAFDPTLSPH